MHLYELFEGDLFLYEVLANGIGDAWSAVATNANVSPESITNRLYPGAPTRDAVLAFLKHLAQDARTVEELHSALVSSGLHDVAQGLRTMEETKVASLAVIGETKHAPSPRSSWMNASGGIVQSPPMMGFPRGEDAVRRSPDLRNGRNDLAMEVAPRCA
jgi:hypothetical protein